MRNWINLIETTMAPTWLYHGTYRQNLDLIKKEGLRPDKSQSSLEAIFLAVDEHTATGYEGHHHINESAEWVVLKINVSKLAKNFFGPDNYELDDILYDLDSDDPCYGMKWQDVSWEDSLRLCGQCAYYLTILPSAIVFPVNS